MNRIYKICSILFLSVSFKAQNQSFTITNLTGSDTITCARSAIVLSVSSSYTGGPVNYTWSGPGTFLSNAITVTLTIPGIYTVDASTTPSMAVFSGQTVAINSQTTLPNISAIVPTQMLSCAVPQTQLTGTSTTQGVTYSWTTSGGTIAGSSVMASTITGAPSQTFVGFYTLTVTDKFQCKSYSVIPLYQNIYPPIAKITNGGMNVINCAAPNVVFTNVSIQGGGPVSGPPPPPVIGIWSCPAPMGTFTSSTCNATVGGTYTFTAKDLGNGCTSDIIFSICTVGLDKNGTPENIPSIFPNPNNGFFTIDNPNEGFSKLEIYNALGAMVQSQNLRPGENEIDIQSRMSGIYFIKLIQFNSQLRFSRILKQ